MTSDPILQGQPGLSIGGENIAFTMQAEAGSMTLDEAMASGLFDLPDEPGMVRFPVTINVTLPDHLKAPPGPPPGEAMAGSADRAPPDAGGGRAHTRFGNYPR